MSKVYVNMTVTGYIDVAALAVFAAGFSQDGDFGALGSVGPFDNAPLGAGPATAAQLEGTGQDALATAGASAGKVDAAGTVFDPARHTGSIVKAGLWRMKTGLSRGPGEGEDSPSYVNPNGVTTAQATQVAPVTGAVDEDDEFAAFTAAANTGAAVVVPARTWTDADLSKLTNQAAQKLGSPDKVRETIAKHVPADQTPHSRNIPADKREAFAVDLETAAGIEYAG